MCNGSKRKVLTVTKETGPVGGGGGGESEWTPLVRCWATLGGDEAGVSNLLVTSGTVCVCVSGALLTKKEFLL